MPAFRPLADRPETAPPVPGRGRSVLLVVTGGIAAYKACLVLRGLQEAGCRVRVAMTRGATRFVTPMTFEALSGQAVGTSLWGEGGEEPLDHIQWAREADLLLVAPATMDFLARISLGLAGDLPSTLVSAFDGPVVVAPAMNDRMWRQPSTQEHLERLRSRGVRVVEPGSGWLACGITAEGRLAEPGEVVAAALGALGHGPLHGQHVVVTAGGTREPVDAVRFLGNHSSGRMGMALATAARDLGARVTLLLGPTELAPPDGVGVERFTTTAELQAALQAAMPTANALAMAAAVSDYRPAAPATGKQKKSGGVPGIALEPTPDLLAAASEAAGDGEDRPFFLGFALETGGDAQVEEQAAAKLAAKRLDLVVGNRGDAAGEGFGGARNRVYLHDRSGHGEWLPEGDKLALAREIWARAIALAGGETGGAAA